LVEVARAAGSGLSLMRVAFQGRDVEREWEAIVIIDVVELAEQRRLLIPS
jgi:hypothetical protein